MEEIWACHAVKQARGQLKTWKQRWAPEWKDECCTCKSQSCEMLMSMQMLGLTYLWCWVWLTFLPVDLFTYRLL